jgi:hypothetical protein
MDAERLLREGKRDEAERLAGLALGLVAARRVLAWLTLQRGDLADCREHVRCGLELANEDVDLHFLAGCLAELEALAATTPEARTSALTRAESHLRSAVDAPGALLPLGARVLVRLSTVRLLTQRFGDARRGFEAALVREPEANKGFEASLGVVEASLGMAEPREALERVRPMLQTDDHRRPDPWILAALAAEACSARDEMKALAIEAEQLLPNGMISPHRAERWHDLSALLVLYDDRDLPLIGPLGQLVALMLGRHESIARAAARPLDPTALAGLLSRVLMTGRVDRIVALNDARAEAVLPGIGEVLQRAVTGLAGGT